MLCGERFGERGGDRADERVAAPASSSPARPVASNTIWRASPRRRCRSPPALARPLAPTTAPGGVRCRGPLRAARGRDVERILAPPRAAERSRATCLTSNIRFFLFSTWALAVWKIDPSSTGEQTRATARGDERADREWKGIPAKYKEQKPAGSAAGAGGGATRELEARLEELRAAERPGFLGAGRRG